MLPEYAATFADCQHLRLLEQKILRAISVLQSDMAVLETLQNYSRRLQKLDKTIRPSKYLCELNHHILELKSQCGRLDRVVKEVSGTNILVRLPPYPVLIEGQYRSFRRRGLG